LIDTTIQIKGFVFNQSYQVLVLKIFTTLYFFDNFGVLIDQSSGHTIQHKELQEEKLA
jgi:hypothetical protein